MLTGNPSDPSFDQPTASELKADVLAEAIHEAVAGKDATIDELRDFNKKLVDLATTQRFFLESVVMLQGARLTPAALTTITTFLDKTKNTVSKLTSI